MEVSTPQSTKWLLWPHPFRNNSSYSWKITRITPVDNLNTIDVQLCRYKFY